VKLVDANVLVYAVDRGAAHHTVARDSLDSALNDSETIILPWVSLLAFMRLITNPRLFDQPLDIAQAMEVVELWLDQAVTVAPEPDARHSARLRVLLGATGRGGNLVNDAHLAALALQYRATVITFDNDFGRFPGVAWERPAVD